MDQLILSFKMLLILVNGSCPNSVFIPREGFRYYVNPALGATFDQAVSVCQGYGDGYNLASILVLILQRTKYIVPNYKFHLFHPPNRN